MASKIIINDLELFQINGFENYYLSVNCDIYNKKYERFLTPTLDDAGYYQICIRKNGVRTFKRVHRLLAEAFIHNDDPINKPEVDHINRVRTDNGLGNLKWASRQEQIFNRGLFKNNTSGTKGVSLGRNRIVAQWYDDGMRKSKSFNITNLGYNEAFELARNVRKAKMLEIYNIVE